MKTQIQFSHINTGIVLCENAFTDLELTEIETVCEDHMKTNSFITHVAGRSNCMWVPRVANTRHLYSKFAKIAQEVNYEFFQFDLTGYVDDGILYLDYKDQGDHFDWHVDNSEKYRTGRDAVKLIVILQLTDPLNYTGAIAEIAGTGITQIPKKRGLISIIPGYTSHRVTELESGRRKILSAWFTGPKFK